MTCIEDNPERTGHSFIGGLLHRRQIFDWKHHALVLISYVKNLRNRRSLLVPLRGFTLAEVLITLGIIGVVAALTIPTLMQKIDERETVSKVKKFYSVFSEAYKLATLEHGTIDNWGLENDSDRDNFWNIMGPYFSNVTTPMANNKAETKFSDGTSFQVWFPMDCLTNSGGICAYLYFYTDSKPIVQGKNRFIFIINKKGVTTFSSNKESFDYWCKNSGGLNFAHCTGWVLYKENLDYLHCRNDLSWNEKQKCD